MQGAHMIRTRIGSIAIGLASVLVLTFASPSISGQAKDTKPTFPKQILIIRHAEKLPDEAKSADLSPEGKERAAELHKLFEKSDKRPTPFATPDFIFAAKDSTKSHRPVLTVTPLAKALKMTINTEFSNDDPSKLADEIFNNPKYADKVILISWRHGGIPALAEKLKATGYSEVWKGEVFDRVWQITFDDKGKATFTDRPMQLMPKDSEK
jgi:hypothetical protein